MNNAGTYNITSNILVYFKFYLLSLIKYTYIVYFNQCYCIKMFYKYTQMLNYIINILALVANHQMMCKCLQVKHE